MWCAYAIRRGKERLEQAHKVMGLADTLSVQWRASLTIGLKCALRTSRSKADTVATMSQYRTYDLLKKAQKPTLKRFRNACDAAFEYAWQTWRSRWKPPSTVFGAYNAVTGYYQRALFQKRRRQAKSLYLGERRNKGRRNLDLCASFTQTGQLPYYETKIPQPRPGGAALNIDYEPLSI